MVSFVYLDVGGVVNIDFSSSAKKWGDLRAELGINPGNRAKFDDIWRQFLPDICTTRDIEALVPVLKKELGITLPKSYSVLNGFVKRFESNPPIWPVVAEMKRELPVGLLTNMYVGMFDAIQKTGMLPNVQWDVIIDSSTAGCQKPDRAIFELAQKYAGTAGSNILFVDNSPEHVAAGKNFGWQTFLYDSSDPKRASYDLLSFFRTIQTELPRP